MALTFDYSTSPPTVTIPQADLTLVSGTLYELDLDTFRLDLKAEEASEDGIVFNDFHAHNTEITIAGTTFARSVEITNAQIQFENGSYSVRLAGANTNLFDVENGILIQNTVQVISNNSAGLISSGGAAEIAARVMVLLS